MHQAEVSSIPGAVPDIGNLLGEKRCKAMTALGAVGTTPDCANKIKGLSWFVGRITGRPRVTAAIPHETRPLPIVNTYAVKGFERHAVRIAALTLSAIFALAAGTSVYLFDRDWGSALFLAPFADSATDPVGLFGVLGGNLPSFFHAYAFALLLILMLGRGAHARHIGAILWFSIAAALECLQAAPAEILLYGADAVRTDSTILGSIHAYIANGHFDPGDLLAAGLGCLIAYGISSVLEGRP